MIAIDAADLLGWAKRINTLAFDATGTRLVVAGSGGARLIDAVDGAVVADLPHLDAVYGAAFAPDGARLVTGSADMGVRLWRSSDGALLALAKGHMHDVVAVAWSAAGDRFASASRDGSIRVWRLVGDEPVEDRVVHPRQRPDRGVLTWAGEWSLAPPPEPPGDGVLARLVIGDGVITGERAAVARVWTHEGELIGEILHDHEVTLLAASPAGDVIASCGRDGGVRLWSPAEASPPRRTAARPDPVWAEDFGQWVGLALSPDGERLALAIGDRIEIRAVATGAVLASGAGPGPMAMAHWHGDLLLVRENVDMLCHVYDARDLRPFGTLAPKNVNPVFAGDRLLLHGFDPSGSVVHVFALEPGQAPRALGVVKGRGVVDTVSASADGTRLAVGFRDSGAVLANLRTAGLVGPVGHAGWGGAKFSPDGARLLTSGQGGCGLWDVRTGVRLADLGIGDGWHAAWSPAGDRMAICASSGPVILLDGDGRELARNGGVPNALHRMSNPQFSPDGWLLCAWHGSQPVRVWSAITGTVHAELGGHAGDHICVRFLGDQRLLSWEQGGITPDLVRRLWDRDGRLIAPLAGQAGERHWELAVTDAGDWIASAAVGDPDVHVWRTADGEPFGPLGGHRDLVRWVKFAAGGLIVTGCDAGTLRIWSLPR